MSDQPDELLAQVRARLEALLALPLEDQADAYDALAQRLQDALAETDGR